ncbi:hypothetical protein M514_07300 [Trichuris suis]|uniref:Uncharacterized protein n=2 Tax=Trichuris suis TaxID=68888 RepID=A0A085N401_9BILA|nr:hypothetical protein M513_07300 [Trichuris suis]KFD64197.1 hypothetical protein M514_07300 [Trichuris suis]
MYPENIDAPFPISQDAETVEDALGEPRLDDDVVTEEHDVHASEAPQQEEVHSCCNDDEEISTNQNIETVEDALDELRLNDSDISIHIDDDDTESDLNWIENVEDIEDAIIEMMERQAEDRIARAA